MLAVLIHRRRTRGASPASRIIAMMAASSGLALLGGVVMLFVR